MRYMGIYMLLELPFLAFPWGRKSVAMKEVIRKTIPDWGARERMSGSSIHPEDPSACTNWNLPDRPTCF